MRFQVADDNAAEKLNNTVEFKHVYFKYPSAQHYVLQDISFKVKGGEKFVIMGQTGAGKSALLSLIPKMYEASSGEVLINGQNVRDWDIRTLREWIGYVPQKTTLFTGSIIDNVRWGDSEASAEEVFRAAQIAQIHDSIMNFDDAYSTKVGQQGVNLSGGQKQRLAIARALIKKPGILILDDSTSALDIHTEGRLFDALKNLDMTRIIVTQKIHTAKTADQILLLDQGRIVALGTHEELMNSSRLYRDIARSQEEAHD